LLRARNRQLSLAASEGTADRNRRVPRGHGRREQRWHRRACGRRGDRRPETNCDRLCRNVLWTSHPGRDGLDSGAGSHVARDRRPDRRTHEHLHRRTAWRRRHGDSSGWCRYQASPSSDHRCSARKRHARRRRRRRRGHLQHEDE
jgi:hypothetical protein